MPWTTSFFVAASGRWGALAFLSNRLPSPHKYFWEKWNQLCSRPSGVNEHIIRSTRREEKARLFKLYRREVCLLASSLLPLVPEAGSSRCSWFILLQTPPKGWGGLRRRRLLGPMPRVSDLHFHQEAPILWPPNAKSQLIRKDPDARKDWRQEEKGTTEDEVVGWHHQLNGHEFEQALGDGEGQEILVCYSPWGCKESDTTEWLNNKNLHLTEFSLALNPYCKSESLFYFILFLITILKHTYICGVYISQFSHSVVSGSLWPHGLQHARLPWPSPTPRACSNSCPSCHT